MDTTITRTAYELTFRFQDVLDIPTRYKNRNTSKKKADLNSKVEQIFQSHVEAWTETINSILKYTKDKEQAWRFIRIEPKVDESNIDSVTLCPDFIAFHDLLYQRRKIDNCPADELGKLCMLVMAFQMEIEKQINR